MNDKKIKFLRDLEKVTTRPRFKIEVKELWPELFEVKLEVGKWYKRGGSFLCFKDMDDGIIKGIVSMNDKDWYDDMTCGTDTSEWTPATDKEVEEMLIKEAKKRFGDNRVQCLSESKDRGVLNFNDDRNNYSPLRNKLWIREINDIPFKVFDNGKWATIIEQPLELTVEQISEEYGREVKIVKK